MNFWLFRPNFQFWRILGNFFRFISKQENQNKIQDFVSLKNIKPETVLAKVKSYKPYLVRIPLKCDIMKNGCDKDKISDELSMYLNISHSRLNVKIIN